MIAARDEKLFEEWKGWIRAQHPGGCRARINLSGILVKILILGAGQVGSTVAESLVGEANDITVVDSDGEKLRQLQDQA